MKNSELSKEVSYALRHAPWKYELEMDKNGWVEVNQLLDALHRDEKWKDIQLSDLIEMIETSDKKRHEIVDGKIRAYYGHSIPMHIKKEKQQPPNELFHGTARRFLENIENNGLLPMSRQYVHLSIDIETAFQVGKRHDNKPIILKINALEAWNNNVAFYRGNEKVWLSDNIPFEYIQIVK
jgi:putative RNA 2'-phosphotransferase